MRLQRIFAGTAGPLMIQAWQYLPAMDIELPFALHLSDSIWHLMKDPEFDRMFLEQRSLTNEEKRQASLRKLSAWFRDYAPAVFLYQVTAIYGTTPQVEKVDFRSDLTLDFTQVVVRR